MSLRALRRQRLTERSEQDEVRFVAISPHSRRHLHIMKRARVRSYRRRCWWLHVSSASRRPRRAGAAAGAQSRPRRSRVSPRHRCDAREARAGRVDQLAAHLRRHRLQPADADQQTERRPAAARVVVGHAGRPASADAARARWRDVPADARRRRAGGRRHQRRFPLGVPRAGSRKKATATCAPRRRAISRSTATRST